MAERLSLDALLEDPDHGGLTVLAGSGTGRVFTDAVTVTHERYLPDQARGQLAIVLQEQLDSTWRLEALIRRVCDRGFNGVVVPAPLFISPGTEALAQRLDVVVLSAEQPAQVAHAVWRHLEGRDTLALSYVRKVARSIEYQAENLADLLRHMADGIGHAVAVVDAEGPLHVAGPRPSPELLAAIRPGRRLQSIRGPHGCAAIVPVDVTSRPGLHLVVHGGSLSDVQLRALTITAEIAMPVIAARILIDEVVSVSDVARSETLLADLLASGGSPPPALDARLTHRGWRTGGWHLGLRFTPRTRHDVIELLRLTARELTGMGPVVRTAIHDSAVTGWISWTEEPDRTQMDAVLTALRQAHRKIGTVVPVATGIGRPAPGPQGLVASIGEARDAALLAARRPSSGWFVRVESLGYEQLLAAWTNPETFQPAARTLLAPLSGTEVRTLSAYLDHESSLTAKADAIQVHRNTIGPRVQRIQERLNLDLTDPDVRLALHLACRAVTRG